MHKGLVLTVIALCVVGVITAITSYVFQHINLNNKMREDLRANVITEDFSFHQKERTVNPEIINIALLGIDSWDNFAGRSDSIIVITLDYNDKTIKLSSFMRDLRVDIHGHGTSKLGHAYSYGGGELLIRTLNENYGLAIDNYIALNFSSFEKIIDLFGGLELDIDIHEKNEINKVVKEPDIETTGMQLLNGKQTLAYSRIREVGRADFERTERQRRIVEELIRNSAALSLTELYNLALNIKGLLEMNLDLEEILQLIYVFDNYREKIEIKSIRFPIDGSFRSGIISGVYYLIPLDENATRYLIRSHIYGNN